MRWVWCEVTDDAERPEEPDWSKVPEERRETVRARWLASSAPAPRQWLMWEPQVAWYNRQPGYRVVIIGPGEPESPLGRFRYGGVVTGRFRGTGAPNLENVPRGEG
jgi:hypothetical protein